MKRTRRGAARSLVEWSDKTLDADEHAESYQRSGLAVATLIRFAMDKPNEEHSISTPLGELVVRLDTSVLLDTE